MAINIQKNLTTVNFTKRGTTPKYIVIHYVGAVSTAYNNSVYFKSTNRSASAHYFVDETSIWQVVEDTNTAWSVGDSGSGTMKGVVMNSNSISIELCVKKTSAGAWYYEDNTLAQASELVQKLMKTHGISSSNVYRHYDVTKKSCPANYLTDSTWSALKAKLTGSSTTSTSTTTTTATSASTTTTSSSSSISVDGQWGTGTTKKAQKVFGTTQDGTISNQRTTAKKYHQNCQTTSWKYSTSGSSALIKAIQKKCGISQDGLCGINTAKAIQKLVGTTQDGYIGANTVKAFQTWLNKQ